LIANFCSINFQENTLSAQIRKYIFLLSKKSPRQKATGLLTKPHRSLAHLYSGAINLSNSPLYEDFAIFVAKLFAGNTLYQTIRKNQGIFLEIFFFL
jgi:hypothetical protein